MSFLCKNHPIVETEITSDHNDPQASVGRFLGSLEEVAWKKSLIRGNRQGEAGPAERGSKMSSMLSQEHLPHPRLEARPRPDDDWSCSPSAPELLLLN